MTRLNSILLVVLATVFSANAFSSTAFLGSTKVGHAKSRNMNSAMSMRVVDIEGEEAFDNTVSSAGEALVVVDYSTAWCGPCKVIAPKFDELSDKYPDAVFLKVMGDANPSAGKLMKREGVRSVPSFHYFKNGERVDVVNGANVELIEASIKKFL